jgi:hypothetical protein
MHTVPLLFWQEHLITPGPTKPATEDSGLVLLGLIALFFLCAHFAGKRH